MKMIIPCLLVFMTVPSLFAQNQSLPVGECLSNTTLSERLQFAGIDRAREILGRSDEWARQLSEFHMLSQEYPARRDELYTLLGFRRFAGFEYPVELEERRLSNPIYGDRYEYALTVQTANGTVDVTPVYQAAVPLEEFITISMGHPRELFEAINFVLLPVNTGTRTVLRDDSGKPIVYKFEDTDWIERMQRNSSYIIHPDELMAENFALLMEWRRSGTVPESVPGGPGEGFPVNDIGLLTEIEKVLTAGCEE